MGMTHNLKRVLVLGGTGFIGSEIVRAFLRAGCGVVALARTAPNEPSEEWKGAAEFVAGSIEHEGDVAALLPTVDHIVHAVGCSFPAESIRDPVGDILGTVPGLLRVLDALRAKPEVRFTFLSSGGTVYGNPSELPVRETSPCEPITPYGVTKLVAEKYIGLYSKLYGVDARILRISNAYGARQSAARGQGLVAAAVEAAITGDPITLYGQGAIRDYVNVRDVANAVVDLAYQLGGPQIVNVGSGVGHSVADVVRIVERLTGRAIQVIQEAPRSFDVREIVLDVGLLRELMRWEPISLEGGIARIWAACEMDGATVGEELVR